MIPTDLVPLAEIARQLRTSSSRLAAASARGDFPATWRVAGASWRVSRSAVEAWFAARSAERLHAEAEVRHEVRRHRASCASRVLDLRTP